MSTYTFDEIVLPSGRLKIQFINNDGNNSSRHIGGEYLINIASLRESVEENGIGGIPRIADMDIELYDRDSVFYNTILRSGYVTECYANISIINSGIELSVIYGLIDLTTVSYSYIYEDDTYQNEHNVRFTIFSILSALKSIPISNIRSDIQAHSVSYLDTNFNYDRFINIKKLFEIIFARLFPDNTVVVEFSTIQRYGYAGQSYNVAFDVESLYLMYKISNGDYAALWNDSTSGSFMGLLDAQEVLKKLCQLFLVYPVITYDPTTTIFTISLKHRNGGGSFSAGTDTLISANEQTFFGYDAVRVYHAYSTLTNSVIYPSNISSDSFAITTNKYDFVNLLAVAELAVDGSNFLTGYGIYAINIGGVGGQNGMWQMETVYTPTASYPNNNNSFLLNYFVNYWGNKPMIERKYRGAFSVIQLLDRLVVNGMLYPIFEIERDLVANEVTYKCVQY